MKIIKSGLLIDLIKNSTIKIIVPQTSDFDRRTLKSGADFIYALQNTRSSHQPSFNFVFAGKIHQDQADQDRQQTLTGHEQQYETNQQKNNSDQVFKCQYENAD